MRAVPPLLATLAACSLGLWGCRAPAIPTLDAQPTATTAPATKVAATATNAPETPQTESTWTVHQAEAFSIRLPASWRAGSLEAGSEAARLSAFQQDNPELAGFLGGVGSRPTSIFSAQDESGGAGRFGDNVNIRRMAWNGQGIEALPEIAAAIATQYRQLGFDVLETATELEIGGQPSARIAYAFSTANHDRGTEALNGLQLLVGAPDNLWILTYTTTSGGFAALRPVFEESAKSFRIK